ncbi:MAG TPA: riboflavin kinase [Candidatus Woesebacteria bacterium]|nr:riboflavin kinase [Candidatus Woesebacteria bacterium]
MKTYVVSAKVKHGDQHGRSIGHPTINLDSTLWPADLQPGVYASKVTLGEKQYLGALYFGPRSIKAETKNILEITLFEFSDTIYGEVVSVLVGDFVREPIEYQPGKQNENALKEQIADDVSKVMQLGRLRWPQLAIL